MLGQEGSKQRRSLQDRRMPKRPAALPSELSNSFTCAEARATGVTARRLRAKDLEIPFRGVRSAAGEKEPLSREEPLQLDRAVRLRVLRLARAYELIMPPHAFFAGRTAAVIYGAPLAHGDELEVAVHAPARPTRRRGVRCVKVSPHLASVRELEGLRLSSPASTWAMLGATLTERQLVIVGDAFVRVARDDRGIPTIAGFRRAPSRRPMISDGRLPRDPGRELRTSARRCCTSGSGVPPRWRPNTAWTLLRRVCRMLNSMSRSTALTVGASGSRSSYTDRSASWSRSRAITIVRAAHSGTATSRNMRPTSRPSGRSCA